MSRNGGVECPHGIFMFGIFGWEHLLLPMIANLQLYKVTTSKTSESASCLCVFSLKYRLFPFPSHVDSCCSTWSYFKEMTK